MKNKSLAILLSFLIFTSITLALNESGSDTTYTIAVTDFTMLGVSNDLQWIGESCADGIRTKLSVEKNIRIVERQFLSTIIEELKFQESGLVNENSAVELGKLTGAKYFILGSATIINKSAVLRARLVNVETAQIIHTSEATGTIENIFQLQTELARKIAIKILGNTIIQNSAERNDVVSFSQSIRTKLNTLKKLSESLPLFALDPARKRKIAEYTTAGILCDGIIESYPEAIIGYYYKALFSMHAEEYDETNAVLNSAKIIDPINLEILLLRSMYLFHQQKYEEARTLLTYLSMKYPRDSRIWFGLAKTSARLNDYTTVIESLVNAMTNQPYISQAEPFFQTIILEQQSSSFNYLNPAYRDVVSLFRKASGAGEGFNTNDLVVAALVKRRFPELYISYFVTGKIQESTGNRNEAIQNFQYCLELVPSYPMIHRELAYLYLGGRECSLGKQHAALYLKTSQSTDDYKELHERIQHCR